MKINEQKLNELSYVDSIKWLREASENLSYSKHSNTAYSEARDLITYLIKRYSKENGFDFNTYHENEVGRLLFSTDKELDDYYKYAKTDKAKAEVIATFKSDMDDNTNRILHDIKDK